MLRLDVLNHMRAIDVIDRAIREGRLVGSHVIADAVEFSFSLVVVRLKIDANKISNLVVATPDIQVDTTSLLTRTVPQDKALTSKQPIDELFY